MSAPGVGDFERRWFSVQVRVGEFQRHPSGPADHTSVVDRIMISINFCRPAHDTMIRMASFDRVVASFWHSDTEYLRLPPLTDDLVAGAEAQLGVTLPLDLIR